MLPSLNLVNGFDIRAERGWLQWLRIESDWLAFVSWAQPGGHSPFLIGFRREAFPHSSWVKRENTEVVFILWRRLHTLTMASEKVRVWPGWKCLGKLPQCYSSGRDKLSVFRLKQQKLFLFGKRSGFSLHGWKGYFMPCKYPVQALGTISAEIVSGM